MKLEDCPLPEVAEALSPFIKPRDKVARIRQALQAHVQQHTGSPNIPLTPINLTLPSEGGREIDPSSPALTGVRKAYLQALRAHAQAQQNYDAVRADIERLSTPSPSSNQENSEPPASVNQSFIPLLRYREQHRKLQAIRRAFSAITAPAQDATTVDLEDLIKQKAGNLPPPPTASQPAFSEKPDVEARVLRLKKAVLATKRRVDDASNLHSNTPASTEPGNEIAGLQAALNELTAWMETQLLLIGIHDPSTPPPSELSTPTTTTAATTTTTTSAANPTTIQNLYKTYLTARTNLLLTTTTNPPSLPSLPPLPANNNNNNNNSDLPSPRKAPPTSNSTSNPTPNPPLAPLLPLLPHLPPPHLSTQTLQFQPAFLRHQLTSSEQETQRLFARKAGESQFVAPGAGSGGEWAAAGDEASGSLRGVVGRRVGVGETALDEGRRWVGE
ncbi:hypothetical protein B0A50_07858, partial [Salinomyces thailandicus]